MGEEWIAGGDIRARFWSRSISIELWAGTKRIPRSALDRGDKQKNKQQGGG